jgi:hypothetical protein
MQDAVPLLLRNHLDWIRPALNFQVSTETTLSSPIFDTLEAK